jgi:hypothetical protein
MQELGILDSPALTRSLSESARMPADASSAGGAEATPACSDADDVVAAVDDHEADKSVQRQRMRAYVCVCARARVCVCVRACVLVCVCVCVCAWVSA